MRVHRRIATKEEGVQNVGLITAWIVFGVGFCSGIWMGFELARALDRTEHKDG